VRQIFVDCDGVLADFDSEFFNRFGMTARAWEDEFGSQNFWRAIAESQPKFFRNLPKMADAGILMSYLEPQRPIILTGCPRGNWSQTQKIDWARKNFPTVPLITCRSKDKRAYCRPGDILIDDTLTYKHLWEEAGGIFITHTSATNSIRQLQQVLSI